MSTTFWTPIDDELYRERLAAFSENTLREIQSFAQREGRDFQQTRRDVAEWHCKWLFDYHPSGVDSTETTKGSRHDQVHKVLEDTSRILESLHQVSGVHSVFLAIDPQEKPESATASVGFLGGTHLGRQFWNSIRGGGQVGARAFRDQCCIYPPTDNVGQQTKPAALASSSKRTPAGTVKAELYAELRDALRTASGNATAEFKWTNHDKLTSTYALKISGWPSGVPNNLNPSVMSLAQNTALLNALRSRELGFVRLDGTTCQLPITPIVNPPTESMSWDSYLAIDDEDMQPFRKRTRGEADSSGKS